MIDKEKVIKGLECCILRNPDDRERCSQCSYSGNCVNRLKTDALELLKEQDATPTGRAGQCPAPTDEVFGRWISVKDRLPEKGETVLLTVIGNGFRCTTVGSLEEIGWCIAYGFPMVVHPAYWMPLPEPA